MENSKENKRPLFILIGIFGWANLITFLACIIYSNSDSSTTIKALGSATFIINIIGTSLYCIFWNFIFKSVNREKALPFFMPYRVGLVVPIFIIVIIYLLISLVE